MAWFKVDDGLPEHRKVRRLGRDKTPAMGVWVLCGAWAAGNLTDGFVPAEVVRRYDPRESYARKLVTAGMWSPAEHDGEPGYRFHDWLDHQPSRTDIETTRRENARRQQQYRGRKRAESTSRNGDGTYAASNAARNALRDGPGDALRDAATDGVTNGATNAVSNPAPGPTRPDPTPGGQAGTVGASTARAHARGPAALAATAHTVGAHRLVEAYAATCRRRPPTKILTQLAVEVDALLAEAWPDDEIAAALTAWGSKTLGPGALQAVAHEVVNRRPAAPTAAARSTTDDRVAAAQALKAQLRALPGGA